MRKTSSGRFHKQNEISSLASRPKRSLESGFTQHDYEQIEAELEELYSRLKMLLEKLVYSNATEYFRLSKIVDNSLEELRVKVHSQSISEFPDQLEEVKPIQVSTKEEEEDSNVSWKVLCQLEPKLFELWSEAKAVEDNHLLKTVCSLEYFSSHFADRLTDLLGPWHDNLNPKLQSVKSIDLAKDTLIDALPPCRNCKKHNVDKKWALWQKSVTSLI